MPERSYLRIMKGWSNPPVESPDEEWLSQYDAARELGISVWRVGWRIACGHLTPAHNRAREAGVTRESVAKDREWLAQASLGAKSLRVFKNIIRWV